MINLKQFFNNHFATKEISDNSLKQFAEIHIQRLAAKNTGGQYNQIISDTTTVYDAYLSAISDEDTKFAAQQGRTINLMKIVDEFKQAVSQKEGTIRGIWGVASKEYQEFFPYGITEYWAALLSNIESLITRFVNSAVLHQADLGAAFVDMFNVYKTNFANARSAQLLKMAEVVDAKTLSAQNRKALEIQLMKNINMLAIEFAGNVDEAMDFFNQSVLKNYRKKKTEIPIN